MKILHLEIRRVRRLCGSRWRWLWMAMRPERIRKAMSVVALCNWICLVSSRFRRCFGDVLVMFWTETVPVSTGSTAVWRRQWITLGMTKFAPPISGKSGWFVIHHYYHVNNAQGDSCQELKSIVRYIAYWFRSQLVQTTGPLDVGNWLHGKYIRPTARTQPDLCDSISP